MLLSCRNSTASAMKRLLVRQLCSPNDGLFIKRAGNKLVAPSFSTLGGDHHHHHKLSSISSSSSFFSTAATSDGDQKKPFDKVLIANRGEIVQRVVRTCRSMGIGTVAVYSTADAQAPFVQEADEAICLGPAAASKSYLNKAAIFQAIRDTGAQAVHPGYGFLSENATFAREIKAETGAVWLGPPPNALFKMGDKLESKQIAQNAGVTIVPGHEKPLESLEQALQLCNDGIVPYPVLLKAAAGGGGKGMRTCYNDQDLKEAWSVSKAESLQFFSDDRLLLEKFIVEPHHIEFQVMCAPTAAGGGTDVVVFPERECSIQRRNQKVIEESPSTLLREETRRKMADEVVRLCQAVGYESAGTIEFLVDEQQNYYFLEMNTRLQVEHCVTEEVVGGQVDLVKAMLWIGAGWGFPEQIQALRGRSGHDHLISPTHHAIEARIYAEDPLRGFLPSTGPLIPYVEPKTCPQKLRVDSGVAKGHNVTPHYDPMLSKVISSGLTRSEAIQNLSQAMDEYVIQGVQHNARLISAICRNEAFQLGRTPTSFLPKQFPDGFTGVQLNEKELKEFAASAFWIDQARRQWLHQPVLAGGATADKEESVIVRLGGFFGTPYRVRIGNDHHTVHVSRADQPADGGETPVSLLKPVALEPERYSALLEIENSGDANVTTPQQRSIQVLSKGNGTGELKLQMFGCDMTVVVQSEREYELSKHMKEPPKVDTSSMVLSPMPGTLISFSVAQGDAVMEGQVLCIIEAMKMQNIIRSPKKGVISAIKVNAGDSLKADQVILEFEK